MPASKSTVALKLSEKENNPYFKNSVISETDKQIKSPTYIYIFIYLTYILKRKKKKDSPIHSKVCR